MRIRHCVLAAVSFLVLPCAAQEWELGVTGGYGLYSNPSIKGPNGSLEAAFPAKGTMGVVFGQNMYEHFSGEVRWLYQFGGPELKSQGNVVSSGGYSNLITYDVLIHTANREGRFRPYVSAGAGISVYTGHRLRLLGQPFVDSALLLPATQVEPAISAGAGLKYLVARHVLLRLDFRTYFSPAPDEIFRPVGFAQLNGWIFHYVPLAGVSAVF